MKKELRKVNLHKGDTLAAYGYCSCVCGSGCSCAVSATQNNTQWNNATAPAVQTSSITGANQSITG